ncbi:ML domain-containing protein [Cantharellus anzutake]|uniref:ML domain-containing protein n=1 Tax=Cantharellus anzutake TaxID=1750568 RepID=UPI001907750B|nr:ML domain-containing protein [Cantharellus anzutake]KAF8338018.1 ML domain-containing protein [Cantharellus anzutake]
MRIGSLAALFIVSAAQIAHGAWTDVFKTSNDGPVTVMNSWSYKDCGLPTDVVQLEPPVPGEDLTVTAEGTVTKTIEEGAYANVVVKLGVIKLLQKTFDVCEEARHNNATIQCPVEADHYTVVQTVALPKDIPKAKFSVEVRGYTKEDENMLCVNIYLNFMKPIF